MRVESRGGGWRDGEESGREIDKRTALIKPIYML